MYIPKRQSVIHSCRKYWNKAANVPVVPASSSLTPVSTCGTGRKAVARSILIFLFVFPGYRLSYVPPGRSGSSSPVLRIREVALNHELTLRIAALLSKA
ncbi:hypothetical protein T05_13632 [Trichinella murrelli]|uniref:Uncharacterized protein n=1 Tax=Trichinella murrelli TaxID=144512 RepID=A0A0V0T787_9BILA|nr:hypothetical protein T05_13632 [Trichinella murrelli]